MVFLLVNEGTDPYENIHYFHINVKCYLSPCSYRISLKTSIASQMSYLLSLQFSHAQTLDMTFCPAPTSERKGNLRDTDGRN